MHRLTLWLTILVATFGLVACYVGYTAESLVVPATNEPGQVTRGTDDK
ncbi:hypothetical protein AB1046_21465 [Promicromonospora sp. Populi]